MSETFDFAVIGRGLMGSAAARHLAKAGHRVVLIGPEEPADKMSHQGVFASHYDEGRITRVLDVDPVWSRLAASAISRYGEIEAEGGIPFFTAAGAMMAADGAGPWMAKVRAVQAATGAGAALEGTALADRFPFFAFAPGTAAAYEPEAGHVSPRRLVAAQTAAAKRHGATVIAEHAVGFDPDPCRITLASGETVEAAHALIATGGYTGKNALSPVAIELQVYARTAVFFEIDAGEARRLATMPSLVWRIPEPGDPYLLPPIRYPNGKTYLKLGGDPEDRALPDAAAISDWFRSGGDGQAAAYLSDLLHRLMPGLKVTATHHEACVTSFTRTGYPVIERVSDRVTLLTGGNGAGAKCSDELGRLGAITAMGVEDTGYPIPFHDQQAA